MEKQTQITSEDFKKMKLESIKKEFERVQSQPISQFKKNVRIAELMTMMEQYFYIPMIDMVAFDELDTDIKSLYMKLSNARIF